MRKVNEKLVSGQSSDVSSKSSERPYAPQRLIIHIWAAGLRQEEEGKTLFRFYKRKKESLSIPKNLCVHTRQFFYSGCANVLDKTFGSFFEKLCKGKSC